MRPLSARNPRVRRLTNLVRRPGERADERVFVVEGPVLVAAALAAGATVTEVYADAEARTRPAVAEVLARLDPTTVAWELPAGTLDRVGDAATSQGLLALVERRDPPWPSPERASLVLVLAEVADPGNVGTLIRAAVAAGAGAVVVAGGADPTGPKVVRASAGAVVGVDLVVGATPAEALRRLRTAGYRLVGTVVDGGTPYDRADLDGPLAIVLGNEAHGLAPEVVADLDENLTIPMAGPTESLNVAMAGTVICFEVLRRERVAVDADGSDRPGDRARPRRTGEDGGHHG